MNTHIKHGIGTLLLVIVSIALVGCNPFKREPKPEEVIKEAMENMGEVTSLTYEGEVHLDIDSPEEVAVDNQASPIAAPKEGSISMHLRATTDVQDIANVKSKFSFSFDVESESLPDKKATFAMEALSTNKIFYMKFTALPDLGELFDISFLEDKWIKVDVKEAKQKYEGSEPPEQKKENSELTEEQKKKLKSVFKRHIIFRVTEVLSEEELVGMENYHYRYEIDEEELYAAIDEIYAITENDEWNDEKRAEFKKSMERTGFPKGEIWIDKKERLFRKITIIMDIQETEEKKSTGSISIDLSFLNYNEPLVITEPTEFLTIEEVISQFMMSLMMKMMPQTVEQQLNTVIVLLMQEDYEGAETMLNELNEVHQGDERIPLFHEAIEHLKAEEDAQMRLEILSGLGEQVNQAAGEEMLQLEPESMGLISE